MSVSREWLFRMWYWYISRADRDADVVFMNYGYAEPHAMIDLPPEMEPNRYSVQLYHHLVGSIELRGKDIVEIGCGRGGGLAYLHGTFSPASAIGIDLSRRAVSFCNRHHGTGTLAFGRGDAQRLSLGDSSCDVVINVESSHRYANMGLFLAEVKRILKPGGYLLLADFRCDHEMGEWRAMPRLADLCVVAERLITRNVVLALDLDHARREGLVRKMVPFFLRAVACNFAGVRGSETYSRFATGKYQYGSYVMRKRMA